jgi:hypothetical protein
MASLTTVTQKIDLVLLIRTAILSHTKKNNHQSFRVRGIRLIGLKNHPLIHICTGGLFNGIMPSERQVQLC